MDALEPWWKHAVVYQIYPRSFSDHNGDGFGDIRGIIDRIEHLERLGVDVVWLSPVYRSPQADAGYDISDYRDVDPLFGTLADLDELIATLHARGMKLVMDLVVNHTSDEHAWFRESRDRHSDKRDWYFWRPARAGHTPGTPGAEPTNWGSFFGGSAWKYDEASGEYYLHLFDAKQPDLNWENRDVREAVYDMMRWWVDRGVDGFRMDVINLVSKTHPLEDGDAEPGQALSFEIGRVANGPRLTEFLEEMNASVGLSERELFTVGEMVAVDVAHAREYTSQFHPRLNMVFTFEHVTLDQEGPDKFALRPLHLPALKKNLAAWQEGLAGEGWNSLFWDNHDQPRVVSRFGDDSPDHREASAKTLATVLHLHRGTPYVYQGEEIGMTNAGFAVIDDYRDVESVNYYHHAVATGADPATVLSALSVKSRDNARTPMCWSPDAMAGFTSGTPWIALNGNFREINVRTQETDPDSVLSHYRTLIRLRHEMEVVREGRFELLLPDDERLWAFTRSLTTETLLVLANLSSYLVGVPIAELPGLERAELILDTHAAGDPQSLHPWESRVYLIRSDDW